MDSRLRGQSTPRLEEHLASWTKGCEGQKGSGERHSHGNKVLVGSIPQKHPSYWTNILGGMGIKCSGGRTKACGNDRLGDRWRRESYFVQHNSANIDLLRRTTPQILT
jgi:hypothetical protein